MKQRLIVSDIDGTLLRSDKTISPQTKAKIFDLIDEGHLFAIATGRMHGSGRIITQDLNYDGFLISCNGAYVKHLVTGEVIQAIAIDKGLVRQVVAICKKHKNYFHLYDSHLIVAEERKHLSKRFADNMNNLPEDFRFEVAFVEDVETMIDQMTVYKIGLYSEVEDDFQKAMDEINALGKLETCKSLTTSFDVNAKGVTKAKGIEAIRDHYNIPLENVIALGDNENDLDMIRYAGVGVAMANATDEVKKEANFITKTNDEDGLLYALETLIKDEE